MVCQTLKTKEELGLGRAVGVDAVGYTRQSERAEDGAQSKKEPQMPETVLHPEGWLEVSMSRRKERK